MKPIGKELIFKYMENLGEKIINKIKERGIMPKPKWNFWLKNGLIWLASIVFLLVGGLAFSVIIYMFKYNNWDVWEYVNDNFWAFVLVTLPYFWLVFLIIFIALVYHYFRHTQKGYKYKLLTIVLSSVGLSLVFGVFMFYLGAGETIDDILGQQLPFYRQMFNKANQHMMIWSHPDNGLLAGTIVSLEGDSIFVLQDFENEVWEVNSARAMIVPEVVIAPGEKIRTIGREVGDYAFEAFRIMPLMPLNRDSEDYPPIIRDLRRRMPPPIERTIPEMRIIN